MNSKTPPFIIVSVGLLLVIGSFFIKDFTKPRDLDVTIEKAYLIMPVSHRVYANLNALNGKYYLFKAKITNNFNGTLEDVTVKYQIPGYIDWSELTATGQMFPGQTLIVSCYPKFDDKITEKTTESLEKAQLEISWDNTSKDDVAEEEFAFNSPIEANMYILGLKNKESAPGLYVL